MHTLRTQEPPSPRLTQTGHLGEVAEDLPRDDLQPQVRVLGQIHNDAEDPRLMQGLDLLQEKLNIEGAKCLRLSGKRRGKKQEKQESWNS